MLLLIGLMLCALAQDVDVIEVVEVGDIPNEVDNLADRLAMLTAQIDGLREDMAEHREEADTEDAVADGGTLDAVEVSVGPPMPVNTVAPVPDP